MIESCLHPQRKGSVPRGGIARLDVSDKLCMRLAKIANMTDLQDVVAVLGPFDEARLEGLERRLAEDEHFAPQGGCCSASELVCAATAVECTVPRRPQRLQYAPAR